MGIFTGRQPRMPSNPNLIREDADNLNLGHDKEEEKKKDKEIIIQVTNELDKLNVENAVNNNYNEGGSSKESTNNCSIRKIPEFMRKVQAKAFEPHLISFGPYHHGKAQLASMEQEKQNAFIRFKGKTNWVNNSEMIVKSVYSDISEIFLRSYDNLGDKWKQNQAKFLQLMIVDGCFMLDFIHECPDSLSNMSTTIKRDMLLLENQLPMKLLEKLHSISNYSVCP